MSNNKKMSKYYKLCVAVAMFLLQALSLNAYCD